MKAIARRGPVVSSEAKTLNEEEGVSKDGDGTSPGAGEGALPAAHLGREESTRKLLGEPWIPDDADEDDDMVSCMYYPDMLPKSAGRESSGGFFFATRRNFRPAGRGSRSEGPGQSSLAIALRSGGPGPRGPPVRSPRLKRPG